MSGCRIRQTGTSGGKRRGGGGGGGWEIRSWCLPIRERLLVWWDFLFCGGAPGGGGRSSGTITSNESGSLRSREAQAGLRAGECFGGVRNTNV